MSNNNTSSGSFISNHPILTAIGVIAGVAGGVGAAVYATNQYQDRVGGIERRVRTNSNNNRGEASSQSLSTTGFSNSDFVRREEPPPAVSSPSSSNVSTPENEDQPMSCALCKEIFEPPRKFTRLPCCKALTHVDCLHQEVNELLMCPLCQKSFENETPASN